MKVYQEVHIKLGSTPETDLIGIVIAFCKDSSKWDWEENKSDLPNQTNDGPAFSVCYKNYDQSVSPLVHVAKDEGESFRVTNITPRNISPTTINKDDYNMIAQRFGNDFRAFCKQQSIGISVYMPKSDLSLKQIINRKPARDAFERYLSYPFRGDDRDDDPLHEFTCTVFRRRTEINLDYLECYLIEDHGLNANDAKKCRNKVEAGLNVLRVCKRL